MKRACVLGGTGFIGHWLARRLRQDGYWVRVVDIELHRFGEPDYADEFVSADLRDIHNVRASLRYQQSGYSYLPHPFEEHEQFDEVYALCCLMGGAGFVFTGEHDAEIMHDSALMNLNIVQTLTNQNFKGKVFYSSSACMYPQELQNTTEVYTRNDGRKVPLNSNALKESDAYKGPPDSEYGWEKLFSERLYLAYARNYGLDVRIARFHNIYGPEGTYEGGKEKAPAATCRKVIEAAYLSKRFPRLDNDILSPSEARKPVTVWGDGKQTRSFLYIDDCIDAVRLLMQSDFKEPINIGSEEMVSIDELTDIAIRLSGEQLQKVYDSTKPQGVRGRNSDNTLNRSVLKWIPKVSLREGMEKTYRWIESKHHIDL